MKLLVIDAGNSRCKFCVGDVSQDFPANTYVSVSNDQIQSHLDSVADVDLCWIASVNRNAADHLLYALTKKKISQAPVFLDSDRSLLPLEIENNHTLGADRIAAATGAYAECQGQVIVVDAGTAMTIDLVDQAGRFRGGNILPGIGSQLNSLAQKTDQLPDVDLGLDSIPEVLGNRTETAIQSGVFWGQVGAMERIIDNLNGKFGPSKLVVTGGYGELLLNASQLPRDTYSKALVLRGLWETALKSL